MSAEDYLPDEDPEDMDEAWYRRGPGSVSCKRCGEANLHWTSTAKGWRLSNKGGIPHSCRHTNQVTSFPRVDLTKVMQPTLSTFPPKESKMDKNAAAFIRNDVTSLNVVFLDSRDASFGSDSERLQAAMQLKKYTYLSTIPGIKSGDWVLVEVAGVVKVALVHFVDDTINIEPCSNVTYKYIIGKVDLAPYHALTEQNTKITELLRNSYQASLREGFRQTLLNGLPEDQRNSISLLLSQGE